MKSFFFFKAPAATNQPAPSLAFWSQNPLEHTRERHTWQFLSHSWLLILHWTFLETTTLPHYACTSSPTPLAGTSLWTIKINLSWLESPHWEASGQYPMEYLPPYSVWLRLGSSLVSDLISCIPEVCWWGLQVASHFQHLVWYIRYLNSSLPWKMSAKMGIIQTSFLMVNPMEGYWITSMTTSSIWDHSRAIELAMQIWKQIWFSWAHVMSEWVLK